MKSVNSNSRTSSITKAITIFLDDAILPELMFLAENSSQEVFEQDIHNIQKQMDEYFLRICKKYSQKSSLPTNKIPLTNID